MKQELERYPVTGRFLMGRTRYVLDESGKQALESAMANVAEYPAGTLLAARGEIVLRSAIMVEGFALRVGGDAHQRCILGICLPGDFIDLHAFGYGPLDHDVIALGAVRIGQVDHDRLLDHVLDKPQLMRAFWSATLIDGAIQRQWTLKVCQFKAPRRLAHLMCELWYRMDMVVLAAPTGFHIPLTQADLAGMCGMTAIHLNRALGELRRLALADFRRGVFEAPDRLRLEGYAQFRPDYLTRTLPDTPIPSLRYLPENTKM